MASERYFLFPPFVVDTREGSLRHDSREIVLRAKTFAVLRYFLERAGELVSKEELLEKVWAGTYVAEGTLTVCITELRKALGDETKNSRFIVTVPKRGYRFIAPVTTAAALVSGARFQASSVITEEPSQHGTWHVEHGAPFVGRDTDLTTLHNLFVKTCTGQRQLVFVTGEPGIGKTTLLEVFLGSLGSKVQNRAERQNAKVKVQDVTTSEAQSSLTGPQSPSFSDLRLLIPDPQIAVGQCIEHYGSGEAYLPILDAIEQLCRAPGGERFIGLLRQHAPTWLVQMPSLLSAEDLAAIQKRIVGSTRERMLREMTGALEAFTADATLILVIEDLHWSDYSTLDLLSFIARRQSPARLMIIGTYRPGEVLQQEHPLHAVRHELQLHGMCEELALRVLTTVDVEAYLTNQFPGSMLPAKLGPILYQRTEGNPLFMVNMVRELLRQGVITQPDGQWEIVGELEKSVVPVGLRQFIEQQSARVKEEERLVLEAASVAGMSFSVVEVAAALGKDKEEIETLCGGLARRSQFLQANDVSTWPDGTVAADYKFLHALYQEVLYTQVSAGRRANLHRLIGERLEAAYSNQTRKVAAELAVHFERGQDISRAVQYLWQAGENAIQQNAHIDAIRLLNHGIELLQTLPDTPERAQQELGLYLLLRTPLAFTKGYVAPELEYAYMRACELCKQVGQLPQLFMVLGGPYALHLLRGELPAAYAIAKERMTLAESLHFDLFLQVAHLCLGGPLLFMGRFSEARTHLEKSLALYKPQQLGALGHLYDPGVMGLTLAAFVLWIVGYPDQALQRSQDALTLARELSHPFSLAYALGWATRIRRLCGEQQSSEQLGEEWRTLCAEHGFAHQFAMATITQGWGLIESGQEEEGLLQVQRGLTAYRATREELGSSAYLILLAETYGKMGKPTEGTIALTEAEEFIRDTEERFWEAELYRLRGELIRKEGRISSSEFRVSRPKTKSQELEARSPSLTLDPFQGEAEAWFRKAIAIAQQQQAKSLELRAAMSLTRLWQQQGKPDEAHELLSAISSWFTEGFDTKDLQEATALLDELSRQMTVEPTPPQQREQTLPPSNLHLVVNKGRREPRPSSVPMAKRGRS